MDTQDLKQAAQAVAELKAICDKRCAIRDAALMEAEAAQWTLNKAKQEYELTSRYYLNMELTRRLNINLPSQTANDLEQLAKSSGRSMTDVVRNALDLVKLAQEARSKNQKLVIADANDKPLKEVVIL